jgi:hypothetical protein
MSNELANIPQNLIKAGRPVSFPAFAAARGFDLTVKAKKKEARLAFGKLQAEFSKATSAALAAATASGSYTVTKFEVGKYADGRRKITAVLAEPKAKETAAAKLTAAQSEIATLKAQIAALKAK